MICPTCKNNMIVVEYKRIELDYCPNCHGVWLDSGELELLLQSNQLLEKPGSNFYQPLQVEVAEAKRKCPICHHLMNKHYIGDKPSVLIDICSRGDGLFFDGGELNQYIKQVTPVEKDKTGTNNQISAFLGELFKANHQ
jgi:Zn-finger nucleic acid-binding protein